MSNQRSRMLLKGEAALNRICCCSIDPRIWIGNLNNNNPNVWNVNIWHVAICSSKRAAFQILSPIVSRNVSLNGGIEEQENRSVWCEIGELNTVFGLQTLERSMQRCNSSHVHCSPHIVVRTLTGRRANIRQYELNAVTKWRLTEQTNCDLLNESGSDLSGTVLLIRPASPATRSVC